MAKQTIVTVIDDLDETSEADETVDFGLDGREYEIDLTEEHASELRDALKRFVDAARRAGGGGRGPKPHGRGNRSGSGGGGSSEAPNKDEAAAIRAWVRENGGDIADRGRIPRKFLDAYRNDDDSIFDVQDEDQDEELIDFGGEDGGEDGGDGDGDDRQPATVGGGSSGVGDPFRPSFTTPDTHPHF